MNKVDLVGRLTADPKVSSFNGKDGNPVNVAQFYVACDRRYKSADGTTADFIPVRVTGNVATACTNYLHKGSRVGVNGSITTFKYTNKAGETVYGWYISSKEVEFLTSKKEEGNSGYVNSGKPAPASHTAQKQQPVSIDDGFMDVPDGIEEELPFK